MKTPHVKAGILSGIWHWWKHTHKHTLSMFVCVFSLCTQREQKQVKEMDMMRSFNS